MESNTSMKRTLSITPFPLWNDPIDLISSFKQRVENIYTLRSKDDGTSRIDINISFYGSNTQSLTSDSYSGELTIDSQKEVELLTKMYVEAVAAVFSRDTDGSTETRE